MDNSSFEVYAIEKQPAYVIVRIRFGHYVHATTLEDKRIAGQIITKLQEALRTVGKDK